jgi:hypothetical protein
MVATWNRVVLTFDVDWCPDFVIDAVAARLRAAKVSSTWFVTHQSDGVARLRAQPDLFELGIHPNFLPGSTHGETPEQVLTHISAIVPGARSLRSHGLVQSGLLLELILRRTDVSVISNEFLPFLRGVVPVLYERGGRRVLKVPVVWADDYEMGRPQPSWNIDRVVGFEGLKVLLFHPLNVYVNAATAGVYEQLRGTGKSIRELTPEDLAPRIFDGAGAATLLDELLSSDAVRSHALRLCDVQDIHVASEQ